MSDTRDAYKIWVDAITAMARAEADHRAASSTKRRPPPTWAQMSDPERNAVRADAARWANALVDAGILPSDQRAGSTP